MITIDRERPFDAVSIENLLDVTFGPERFKKSSNCLRVSNSPLSTLSHVARDGKQVIGTIRFWPIQVRDLLGGKPCDALLLGPLAISPKMQQKGIGAQLMRKGLATAEAAGHLRVLLVGDIEYYGQFGFKRVLPHYISLPGGKDARRLLVRQPATVSSLPPVGKLEVPVLRPVSEMGDFLPKVA